MTYELFELRFMAQTWEGFLNELWRWLNIIMMIMIKKLNSFEREEKAHDKIKD
jgi:hypothetical protein